MNPNIEYEKFIQEIYQELVNADVLKATNVQHNVKLMGKSGQEHQIDVYWEYEIAGVKHKVAIECKNYNKTVAIGKVLDFYGVLADLTNVVGIMVTKVGYQKGAKEYAAEYGISLKELRYPNLGEAIVGEIELNFNTSIRRCLFLVDRDYSETDRFVLKSSHQQKESNNATFLIAPLPESALYKCMADTSILVDIFIDKYLYHLPFHRVIQKYKELGVQLNDTTIYDWFAATCVRLRPIYEALRYCYTYLPRLAIYILDGKYLLDNNKIESSIRPLAVGRNGYLFCDNHNSAIRAAIAYSLIGSCKNANIDPREWLTDVLNKSYKWELQGKDFSELLPQNWGKQEPK